MTGMKIATDDVKKKWSIIMPRRRATPGGGVLPAAGSRAVRGRRRDRGGHASFLTDVVKHLYLFINTILEMFGELCPTFVQSAPSNLMKFDHKSCAE